MSATTIGHGLATTACQLHAACPMAASLTLTSVAGTTALLIIVILIAGMAVVASIAKLVASLLSQFLRAAETMTSTLFTLVILAVLILAVAVHH
jgi:hypothetical protein